MAVPIGSMKLQKLLLHGVLQKQILTPKNTLEVEDIMEIVKIVSLMKSRKKILIRKML